MSVGSLPPSLQSSLESLTNRINSSGGGIQVILLSTSEGVSLGRVLVDQSWSDDLLGNLESKWASPAKQFPLLGEGDVKTVTAYYNSVTVMHIYDNALAPVVVTILLDKQANIGSVKSTAVPLMKEILQPLCQTLVTSLLAPTQPQQPPPSQYATAFYQ